MRTTFKHFINLIILFVGIIGGGTSMPAHAIEPVCSPPTLSISVTPNLLWPANHKYVRVNATATITDGCGDVTLEFVSVESNEPDNGLGDGDTANDIVIVDNTHFDLRAERSGLGGDRIYTIIYQATDEAGNSTTSQAYVKVPLNNSY